MATEVCVVSCDNIMGGVLPLIRLICIFGGSWSSWGMETDALESLE